jgi:hypothetical protein
MCSLSSKNHTMFRARHHPNFIPSRDSTLATSQYHGCGRCGLNGRPRCRLDGPLWWAEVGDTQLVSGGNLSCHMLQNSQPMDFLHAHGSCEYSRPVSVSVSADFRSRKGRTLGERSHVNSNSTMFRACHHPKFPPCRDSTLTTSQYHGRGRCGLNGRPSSRLDGQLWRATVGGSQLLSVPRHAAESPTRPAHGSCETL